ncbi:MAG: ATP-dependent RNA helicase HrpA [Magnetococcales bacterium]|nr:ATP-dependent RNA helicase HrpA [Magnetococcales bacterium]
MVRDRLRFRRQLLDLARRLRGNEPLNLSHLSHLARLTAAMAAARERLEQRLAQLPRPEFPPALPVAQRREEIARLIAQHPIIVLSGETGSGKTTQLPKICLTLGRGAAGMIGVTQPRRIAARSVATYLARDLKTELGQKIGFKVRFHDRIGPDTCLKIMTDGILLAETRSDPLLAQYDTLILDEAHERGLNVDFLIGYVKRLLPRRPDLKVIISSATLDTEKFSQHFNAAPIVEVTGRSYPVEVRYRPLERPPATAEEGEDEEPSLEQAILRAVDELAALHPPGDILIFLPGERDIRDMAEALRKHHPPQTEILPLFARLSVAEQERIFVPTNRRRIVLATNVAETSITVPGIHYVIDSGLARISRFSGRSGIQRLPVEKVSQSSANQRKGRCGRLAPGVCIRLYTEEDFNRRPRFTEPEILRSSLAAVILRMKDLNLGPAERFPFVDRPSSRSLRDGLRLLRELGAVDVAERLTATGERLARLPVDPRLGRMLLEAETRGALNELLIITAALHIQDPRERPHAERDKADQFHRQFQDRQSDFMTLLKLWEVVQTATKQAKSKRKLRIFLKNSFLSPSRVREWQEIHQQLLLQVKGGGARINQVAAQYDDIHQSLLTGLLGNIGYKVGRREFVGARQMTFHIFPGSGLHKKPPAWVMAAELVETTQLYARTCAMIEPQWVEEVAGPLCSVTYLEPHWDRDRGQVMAWAKVTFQGLVLVQRRPVHYGPVDPVAARDIFIQSALVEGSLKSRAAFLAHNQQLIAEIRALEQKARRRDLLVEDRDIHDFYAQRLPEHIHTTQAFEFWLPHAEKSDPRLLFLSREALLQEGAAHIAGDLYPGHLVVQGQELALEYHFNPGAEGDGISVRIPLALLNQLSAAPFEWLVPGLLREKVQALLRALPKGYRRHLVPLPATIERCLATPLPARAALTEALAERILRLLGHAIPPEAWRPEGVADHLRINFKIMAADGERILAQGRDLEQLRITLGQAARESFQQRPESPWERQGITRWDFDTLPTVVPIAAGRHQTLHAFPALRDDGESVAMLLLDAPEPAEEMTRGGLRRLFLLHAAGVLRAARKQCVPEPAVRLAYAETGATTPLFDALALAAAERVFLGSHLAPDRDVSADDTVRTKAQFHARLESGQSQLLPTISTLLQQVTEILTGHHQLLLNLSAAESAAQATLVPDVREQLAHLVHPGFLIDTPADWLKEYPRYLQGIVLRLERFKLAPGKDRDKAAKLAPLWRMYQELARKERERKRIRRTHNPRLEQARWMIEELRISLFAQELKTVVPVSEKRVRAWLSAVDER